MKNNLAKILVPAVFVGVCLLPFQSAHAQPWGFNCCGITAGQSWGWGPGWGGPWGYPGWGGPWGYPYYRPWGYPGWWGPWGPPLPPHPPLVILPPTTRSE